MHSQGRVIAILMVAVGLLCACRHHSSVPTTTEQVPARASLPVLNETKVTTLISDSGVTRYRIRADRWMVFDRADSPYWEFPEGIYLEKFNLQMQPDAFLQADYAHYNETSGRWLLRGHVLAKNLSGEQFESPEMVWSQDSETIHSDSSIVITKQQSIIRGVGFRSNSDMSKYTILHPTGVFPVEE